MIEQAIFTCIGFLVAALLALAATPAVARRARRLAEARARLQAPLTEAQAIAERDALRAQHAVEQFRLEQRLAAVEEASARRLIEIGRQASRLVAFEEGSAQQLAEAVALGAEVRDLRAQLGAAQLALNDLTVRRDLANAALAASETKRLELTMLADEQRARIATLETRGTALEVQSSAAGRAAAAAANTSGAEIGRLSAALGERKQMASRLESDLENVTRQNAKVTADLAAARARLAEAEGLLARSEAAREEAVLENGRQFARIAERDAALRALGAEKRALTEQLSAAGVPGLEAELAEQRREIGRLRARVAAQRAGGKTADDQALRNAIARLGRDVVRLSGKTGPARIEAPSLAEFELPETSAGSEAMHPAPAGKILQGQPMAPER
ncbi:MAG TPA: hypothetical protein VGH40_03365 [Roseiarcus sp.]